MTAEIYQYMCEEYERAAAAGGMKPQLWKKLFATPDALEHMGVSFWQNVSRAPALRTLRRTKGMVKVDELWCCCGASPVFATAEESKR
jgi:hypothetical protein